MTWGPKNKGKLFAGLKRDSESKSGKTSSSCGGEREKKRSSDGKRKGNKILGDGKRSMNEKKKRMTNGKRRGTTQIPRLKT